MRKPRRYSAEQTALRLLLRELGHKPTLREAPLPSVFLDHNLTASFYGSDWLSVYALVLAYFIAQTHTVTPKTLS